MALTGETRNAQKETCQRSAFSTTDPTQKSLVSKWVPLLTCRLRTYGTTPWPAYMIGCELDSWFVAEILMLYLEWSWVWCNLETFRITWNMDTTSAFGLNGRKTEPVGWSHDTSDRRPVRKVSSHFEHLENLSRGLDVTWHPARGNLTVHPRKFTFPWG